MKISLSLYYKTIWGQSIYICGSIPELGNWEECKALKMDYVAAALWNTEIDIEDNVHSLQYYYIVKEGNNIVHREWKKAHCLKVKKDKTFVIKDEWYDKPLQVFLYTSAFTDSFFKHKIGKGVAYKDNTTVFQILCPYVESGHQVILCGSSPTFGEWEVQKAMKLLPCENNRWEIAVDNQNIETAIEYKFAIYDPASQTIIHWETGDNRMLFPCDKKKNAIYIESSAYRHDKVDWKAAGVAIPIFSLRSENSSGIGEFSDLKLLIDWAVKAGLKIVQTLPVNDTTSTHTWLDSYPYNAISTYALHPIYLGINKYPLQDSELGKEYRKKAKRLNSLPEIDYEKVFALKQEYICSLYQEIGDEILSGKDYKEFYKKNEYWLFPYACFSLLRDKYKTSEYLLWEEYAIYNKTFLEKNIENNKNTRNSLNILCFTQYLLHKQLSQAKEYAHKNNVVLKGDIPIGISRNSVEAWTEPHLFNLDSQTGAPPDDFAVNGQNWGFPTYNWDEMAKDNYRWWVKRFQKMTDYFDAYRIDHILGFFRIWEIPQSSVQGLLGYFSPALPLSEEEIKMAGLNLEKERMLNPYIEEEHLTELFGEYTSKIKDRFLHKQTDNNRLFSLNADNDTQRKIEQLLKDKIDREHNHIREGLYHLCNEVLFVRDKREPEKFHPRIAAQHTKSYNALNQDKKDAFNRIYEDFFYHRHSSFWYQEAMKKLPTLISSNSMLVCGEDLGMIPSCVPDVMKELQILSLEIERMPKEAFQTFANLTKLPYLSVCTTSTHDMSPIRAWWKENRQQTQYYYNTILGQEGTAPEDCTTQISEQILYNHLKSPSMLAIIPFQDWIAIDETLRHANPEAEQINIPSNPQHYWKYRMHINLEKLIEAKALNNKIKSLLNLSNRN